jgi:hypothetical protein
MSESDVGGNQCVFKTRINTSGNKSISSVAKLEAMSGSDCNNNYLKKKESAQIRKALNTLNILRAPIVLSV